MSTDLHNELLRFHHFLGEKVRESSSDLTPEEVLDQWRRENPCEEDCLAIEEALADMQAGDAGVDLDEFDRAFRAKHGLANEP